VAPPVPVVLLLAPPVAGAPVLLDETAFEPPVLELLVAPCAAPVDAGLDEHAIQEAARTATKGAALRRFMARG
jgi:hypothetical protein